MSSVFLRILRSALFAVSLAGLAALFGCTSPCEALANQICSCKPNSTEQNACKQLVQSESYHQVSSDENNYCSKLLNTCTCEALERNDLVACGFSKPGGN